MRTVSPFRIGVQDGVELVPTFGWPLARLAYLIAGGPRALSVSVEGAEDDDLVILNKVDQGAPAYLEWNEKKEEANLVMSSQHPFLGSQLTFSEDLQFIEIKWKRIDGQAQIGPQCLLRMFI